MPAEFDHRGRGNSLTIPPDVNRSYSRFLVCVVISRNNQIREEYCYSELPRRPPRGRWDFDHVEGVERVEGVVLADVHEVSSCRKEHVFIFDFRFPFNNPSYVSREIKFEFNCKLHAFEIIECGVQFLTGESIDWIHGSGLWNMFEDDSEFEPSEAIEDGTEYGDPTIEVICDSSEDCVCWSWLSLCFDLSNIVRNVGSLVSGRRR